ncbi:hypothetical protein BOX15_Mlig032141g2 [Macrostomum lignano]|uniref:Reticulon domain-containing protein n=1 Tax=Macrostomum lignano TaxID=282301 RepID=A0A267FYB5_9PLAT|nr:hypothetical protein BOX15_Mlig032141g2 [Macrostomum lignano]
MSNEADDIVSTTDAAGDSAAMSDGSDRELQEQRKQLLQQKQQACGSTPAAMLLYCGYLAERTHPRLKSLLLWTEPRLTGAVLVMSLALLWAVATRSFISVLAYVGLAALMCVCAIRLYRFVRLRRRQQQREAGGAGTDNEENDDEAAGLDEPLPLRCLLHAPVRLPSSSSSGWTAA